MSFSTPQSTLKTLTGARARGDIASAMTCYERAATVMVEPGRIATGRLAVRDFNVRASQAPLVFGDHQFIVADRLCLHMCPWTLLVYEIEGGGAQSIVGCTADVLRRQKGGGWLLAIDNAWGPAPLPKA